MSLERRYHVERIRDGGVREPVQDFCFVLRPERDAHARLALATYAAACQGDNPDLAADLYEWLRPAAWRSQ